jgi:hypothetical protein
MMNRRTGMKTFATMTGRRSPRVTNARRQLALATSLALIATACASTGIDDTTGVTAAGDNPPVSQATSPPPDMADLEYQTVDLSTAVDQLDDPATAVTGLIGVLDVLGIGVYTSDGSQVIAGSETGPDDLWVLAEMLPGMAAAAQRPGPTMSEFLTTLETQLGTGLQPSELAAVYTVMVQSLPEFGLSRVITALDIGFGPDEPLTSLDTWLLLLAWLPPNGSAVSSSATPHLIQTAAAPLAAAQIRCGPTGNGGSKPEYSLAKQYGESALGAIGDEVRDNIADGALGQWAGTTGSAANVAGALRNIGAWVIKPLSMLKNAASAFQVAANFDVAVDTHPISTHEVHDSKGETKEKNRSQITVTATFLGAVVSHPDDCTLVNLLDLPDPNTPIKEAQVAILLDDVLAKHGTVRRRGDQNTARAGTDANGQVVVWYEPNFERPEAAQKLGDAFFRKQQGTFTVTVNVTAAMGQLFNVFSGWEFILDLAGLNEINGEITVGWHSPAGRVAIVEPLKSVGGGPGWVGEQAIYLETCDGVNWNGAVAGRGTLNTNEGQMDQVTDSDVAVIMPQGASSGTSPVLIETDVTGTVSEGTIENRLTQTGTLSLSIDTNGSATLELAIEGGTQDMTISAQGMTINRSGTIEPETRTWTTTIEPFQCDE